MGKTFGFAIGQIRSIEALMLSEQHLLRMADAKDFESAFLVLQESIYSEKIESLSSPFNDAELILKEFEETKKMTLSLSENNPLIKVFWERFLLKEDKTYMEELLKASKKSGSPLFKKYAEAFVELNKILFSLFLNRGKNIDELSETLRFKDYFQTISAGIEYFKKHGSLSQFEKEIDNYLLSVVKRAKYMAFGIDPVFAFCVAKEMEIKNIKLILNGKRLKISSLDLKERLRNSYV